MCPGGLPTERAGYDTATSWRYDEFVAMLVSLVWELACAGGKMNLPILSARGCPGTFNP